MERRRGFVRMAILHLLKEESMHGYQIMKELKDRSNGAYSASAGTVYPALQELLDQNLIQLDIKSDKKVYSINENGIKRLEENIHNDEGDFWLEWKERMMWKNSKEFKQLMEAMERLDTQLRKAAKQIRGNRKAADELTSYINEITDRLKERK